MSGLPEKMKLGGRLGHKRCSTCGSFKPLVDFYKDKAQKKTGYQGSCKKCQISGSQRRRAEKK